MSGGSYNYLCYKDARDLLENSSYDEELECMHNRLAGLGASAAAADTMFVLQTMRHVRQHVDNLQSGCLGIKLSALQNLWHAVEWRDSNDSGEDDLQAALQNYLRERGERARVVPVALTIDEINALVRRLSSTEVEKDGDDRLVKAGIERLMTALGDTGVHHELVVPVGSARKFEI